MSLGGNKDNHGPNSNHWSLESLFSLQYDCPSATKAGALEVEVRDFAETNHMSTGRGYPCFLPREVRSCLQGAPLHFVESTAVLFFGRFKKM